MIIGYDFWCDNVYLSSTEDYKIKDNDGIAFDTCNPITSFNNVKIQNATYDELEILKDISSIDFNTEKSSGWTDSTILLAKFQGNLIGGTTGIDGYDISIIQFVKRKSDKDEWQIYKEVEFEKGQKRYEFIDYFIESEQEYQYGIRPIAYVYDDDNNIIDIKYGEIGSVDSIYITYDYACVYGKDNNNNDVSYTLIYNFKLGDITTNINSNTIQTLGNQYPTIVYGDSNYKSGNVSCLLVTEESATGQINLLTEKNLRNDIEEFLSNKKPKLLKYADGTYLLVNISDNFTLSPNENLLGSYTLSFNFAEIGDANDIETLHKCELLG